jgi:hypothetical protein
MRERPARALRVKINDRLGWQLPSFDGCPRVIFDDEFNSQYISKNWKVEFLDDEQTMKRILES